MKIKNFNYQQFTKRVIETFVVFLFCAVLILQMSNIFLRYTKLSAPWMWVGEFSRYAFIWIVFLLWHLNDRKGSHFVVDVLTSKYTGRMKLVFELFSNVLTIIFACIIMWGSIKYIPTTMLYSTDSFRWLPMGIVYLVIPVGLFLVLVEHFILIFHRLRKIEKVEMK